MSRIVFDDQRPAPVTDPGRADVACFIGLVRLAGGVPALPALPDLLTDWFMQRGWLGGTYARPLAQLLTLHDVPVPVESYAAFLALFDAGGPLATGSDYLAAAVRSFFAQGGHRCYIIRIGDPAAPDITEDQRGAHLGALANLPEYAVAYPAASPASAEASPANTSSLSIAVAWLPGAAALPVTATITATSASGTPVPAGDVTLHVDSTAYTQPLINGFATFTLPAFPLGNHTLTATYTGDAANAAATSIQTVLLSAATASDAQSNWSTVSHLFGLPDVSFLVMPDLPVLCDSAPTPAVYEPSIPPAGPEQFVECSLADLTPPEQPTYPLAAPRLIPPDLNIWRIVCGRILAQLSASHREVQFVAALPVPAEAADLTGTGTGYGEPYPVIAASMPELGSLPESLSTAFLQLAYPWLRTTSSSILREGVEPPDGLLAGILARNALTRGTFRSATKIRPSELFDLWPPLSGRETRAALTLTWGDNSRKPLLERVSAFGPTPSGLRLLSDVTAYPGESYRPASVNRLVSVLTRAANQLGQQLAFASSGPNLWARVTSFLTQLLTRLWRLNALAGITPSEAFSVRCDRTTMTQNDLDNGRVIAVVMFQPAPLIEVIRVTLAIEPAANSVTATSLLLTEVA